MSAAAAVFRRGGSATVLLFAADGLFPIADPTDSPFAAALGRNRFRPITDAASEEESCGWVSPGDPSGESFDPEDMFAGRATWLRMRLDQKRLPPAWLALHRQAAERAAGRKLTAAEARDLKADLMETLLPRVLPTVKLVDALLLPKERKVLVMATVDGFVRAFVRLFFTTFGIGLEDGDPLRLAQAVGLTAKERRALENLAPVAWPNAAANAGEEAA